MRHSIFFFAILFGIACAFKANSATNSRLQRIYTQAIEDFIRASKAASLIATDTLFINRLHNGTEGDFPDIKLPTVLAKTVIRLIEPEMSQGLMKEKPSRILINLIGWESGQKATFVFVVFSNGFAHQFDYSVEYRFDRVRQKYLRHKEVFDRGPFQ